MNGDDGHEDHGHDADQHARVVEGRRHGHHPDADVHLDQVDQGFGVAARGRQCQVQAATRDITLVLIIDNLMMRASFLHILDASAA